MESLSLSTRVSNALVSYVLYLRDMVWPSGLAAFYPFAAPSISETVIAIVILLAITGLAIWFARSLPYFAVGWLWFLGTLVPVIGLVQAGDQGRADRFTYVPVIGLFIALTWLCGFAADRWKIANAARYAVALAIIIPLCFLARRQLSYWKDDLSLWERAVSVTSGNYRAEEHYGVALTDRGRLSEGIQHYEAALRIWPEYPEAHNNLGTARMDQGDHELAIKEFAAAVKARPADPNYRYNLAVSLDAAGRRQEAIDQVRIGLRTNPAHRDLLRAAEVFAMKAQ
jgi:tetratricopeptide (TPR) repeat protein